MVNNRINKKFTNRKTKGGKFQQGFPSQSGQDGSSSEQSQQFYKNGSINNTQNSQVIFK